MYKIGPNFPLQISFIDSPIHSAPSALDTLLGMECAVMIKYRPDCRPHGARRLPSEVGKAGSGKQFIQGYADSKRWNAA